MTTDLVIGNEVVAVSKLPGHIVRRHLDDQELVEIVNSDPRRGWTRKVLTRLELDDQAEAMDSAGYNEDTVITKGEVFIALYREPRTGGTAIDDW